MSGFVKFVFLIFAIVVSIASLLYTNRLVKIIEDIERQRVELWAEAYSELVSSDLTENVSNVVFKMIKSNKTIPVLITDNSGNLITYANIDQEIIDNPVKYNELLRKMRNQHEPITIDMGSYKNYIYYLDSKLLMSLKTYPIAQAVFVSIFLLVVLLTLKYVAKAEEGRILVGMSNETAHQLGTPLSSLMAWIEIMKMGEVDNYEELVNEVENDVRRLEIITERFSRIGSKPKLKQENLFKVIDETVSYLRKRTSKKVDFQLIMQNYDLSLMLNKELFSWVIENLWKNAVDAMGGSGKITITVTEADKNVIIDFADTGKGIPRRKQKTIFKPGFTTKKHGWGLGLTLVKRIIEEYHKGKIFVKSSDYRNGTVFRIVLNKS